MKKILFSLFLFLILTSCSENKKDAATQLIENCADELSYKIFYKHTTNETSINNKEWLKHRPIVIAFLGMNLEWKLKQPFSYNFKVKSLLTNQGNVKVSGNIIYEYQFIKCEKSYTKYPIKFKAKWKNQVIK